MNNVFNQTSKHNIEDINREWLMKIIETINTHRENNIKETYIIHSCNKKEYRNYLYNFNFSSKLKYLQLDKITIPYQEKYSVHKSEYDYKDK